MATWTRIDARSSVSVQTTTETDPSGEDGVDLESVGGFHIGIAADAGQTFTTAVVGAFRGFVRIGTQWYRAPELDFDVPQAAVGRRHFATTGWVVANPTNRIAHVANGVLVSGGGLTLTYEATGFAGHRV